MATKLQMISSGPLPGRACDCSSCGFFIGNPAAAEPVCSGCNTDCSYCGCARSTAGPTGCSSCPIRCGSRVDIAAWVGDVDRTVTFDDIEVGPDRWPAGLPRLVPMVDAVAAVAEVDPVCRWPAYALGLRRVFSARTGRIVSSWAGRTAAEALGLGEGQLAVLAGYGEDPLVEAFWSGRRSGGLIEQLAAQEWDLVLTPNFSMYGNQPRFEHLLNFRRNLMLAAELAAAGVPAVPNLYWFRLEDLDRYLSWIADTAPAAVAVNAQTFRTDGDWADMLLPGLTYLAGGLDDLGVGTRVVVCGTSRAQRLADLARLLGPRLTVVTQNPIQYARHGAVMTAEGRQDIHAAVPDAFAATCRHYAQLLDRLVDEATTVRTGR